MGVHLKTNINVAIKIIDKTSIRFDEEKLLKEIELVKEFHHPHIMSVYESFQVSENLYVVTEYANSGDIFDMLSQNGKVITWILNRSKFTEPEARNLYQQIISGIEYCHSKGIAHRDLKPENLLLDLNRYIKIADFGLATHMKDGNFLLTSCGTPQYAAPEVIMRKPYCGTEIDLWSSGVILFALLSAKLPFDEDKLGQLFQKIKSGDYVFPKYFSDSAKDLIRRILQIDPSKRITINEIKKHGWFMEQMPMYLKVPDQYDIITQERQDEITGLIAGVYNNLNDYIS